MELVHGGQLKNLIDLRAQSVGFTESEASTIMRQIFSAVHTRPQLNLWY